MNKLFISLMVIPAGIGAMEEPSIRQLLSLELLTAADKGDAGRITQLLEQGADPAIQDKKEKNTPLILATVKCYTHAVRALLERMTPPMVNITNSEGVPALLHATANGDVDTVNALIQGGADVNYTLDLSRVSNTPSNTSIYPTALMIALYQAYPHCATLLLQAGADPNIEDRNGTTALHIAAQIGTKPEVMRSLLKKGAHVNKKDKHGRTALYYLVMGGECMSTDDNIEAIEKAGGKLNELCEGSNNLLQLALIAGIKASEQAKKDNTAGDYSKWPSMSLVKTLIKCGINVRHRNTEGKTAMDLIRACNGSYEMRYNINELEIAEKIAEKQAEAASI